MIGQRRSAKITTANRPVYDGISAMWPRVMMLMAGRHDGRTLLRTLERAV